MRKITPPSIAQIGADLAQNPPGYIWFPRHSWRRFLPRRVDCFLAGRHRWPIRIGPHDYPPGVTIRCGRCGLRLVKVERP